MGGLNPVFEGLVRLESKESIGPGAVRLRLAAPQVAREARPGQFVLLHPSRGTDPLLGRPLAVAGIREDRIDLLLLVMGRGTAMLAESLPGEMLRLKGPLGSPLPEPLSGERIHLLGGGAGAAPLLFAADRFAVSGQSFRIWLGVPGRGWDPLAEELARRFGERLDLRSDDGSLGLPGNPVSACKAEMKNDEEAWVCGPPAMVRAAAMSLRDQSARVLISREVRMACGVGGCLGCAVSTRRGQLRACVEGPFFDAREVIFDEEE